MGSVAPHHPLCARTRCLCACRNRPYLAHRALHEDGFGDFCDGFGGGHGKESILRIMKDSHIGGYGVMGLILYFLLYVSLLYELRQPHGCLYIYEYVPLGIILGADVSAKLCTSVLMNALPYARTEEESKVKVLYRKIRFPEYLLIGLPILALLWMLEAPFSSFSADGVCRPPDRRLSET